MERIPKIISLTLTFIQRCPVGRRGQLSIGMKRLLLGCCAGLLALSVLAAQSVPDCDQWLTVEFFQTATVADVIACLDGGADPMESDARGNTPLHIAAANANPDVVKALIAAGADLAARTGGYLSPGPNGQTPLHHAAARNENPAVVEALLAAGADVNARDQNGQTPLHDANAAGTEVLLAAGADVNARAYNPGGWTPLHLAFLTSRAAIELMLAAGADVNARILVMRRLSTLRLGERPAQPILSCC